MLTIADAQAADLHEICALLAAAGLSTEGIADVVPDRLAGFIVAREDGRLVATAGLEDHGEAGVLRSVAVVPDRRNRGLASALVGSLVERSRSRGHGAVYLLTDAAEPYFARFGFRRIDRSQVAPAVAGSRQFTGETCACATAMVLEFDARG